MIHLKKKRLVTHVGEMWVYYNLACNTGIVEMWAVPSRDLQDSSAVGPAIPIYSWES